MIITSTYDFILFLFAVFIGSILSNVLQAIFNNANEIKKDAKDETPLGNSLENKANDTVSEIIETLKKVIDEYDTKQKR